MTTVPTTIVITASIIVYHMNDIPSMLKPSLRKKKKKGHKRHILGKIIKRTGFALLLEDILELKLH